MKLREMKGIGEKTEKLFARLGIETSKDLVWYIPREYEKYSPPEPVAAIREGKLVTIRAKIIGSLGLSQGRIPVVSAKLSDESGSVRAVWFRALYLRNILKPGTVWHFRGRAVRRGGFLQLEQPEYYSAQEYAALSASLQPKYSLTAGLTGKALVRWVKEALKEEAEEGEFLSDRFQLMHGLISHKQAMSFIHFPRNEEMLAKARRRLAFEEFLLFGLSVQRLKQGAEEENTFPMKATWTTHKLINDLPYRLTGAQERSWREIEADLCGKKRMARLLQGDVGSGKTILAFLAMLMTVENGYQAMLMVPTEVLARQHYEAFTALCEEYSLTFCQAALLTGQTKKKEKARILDRFAVGSCQVLIGTQTLIQEGITPCELGLAVIDEQHLFGVRQRERLLSFGRTPHVLVMSATPIPRTLALLLYGDLDISVIDELPGGRLPIKNCVVGKEYQERICGFIEKQIRLGRQAYVICPMVEASEGMEAENVLDAAGRLRKVFPEDIEIGILHGRLRPARKNEVMDAFAAGKIHILVSTTVIEVGINVPNASVMVIEDAERFGLAQLHQLRGRVGRGEKQSYCIFVRGKQEEDQNDRLSVIGKSNDGFFIAGEDLRLRGQGDLFGLRQSGDPAFKVADIYRDAAILKEASEAAAKISTQDRELILPEHEMLKKALEYFLGEEGENIRFF